MNINGLRNALIALVIFECWDRENKKINEEKLDSFIEKWRIKLDKNEREEILQLDEKSRKKKISEYEKLVLEPVVSESFKVLYDGEEKILVEFAQIIGIVLKMRGLSITQIRKFLDNLKSPKINEENIVLLKAYLAYAVSRNKAAEVLMSVLEPCIDNISKEEDKSKKREKFEKFVKFVEAIVAYHLYYGGAK